MSLSESGAQSIRISRTLGFVGFTFLLYDYFLTLDQEVTYVWNAPWTMTKAIFLVNRYANLLGQAFILIVEAGSIIHASQDFCRKFGLFVVILTSFSAESIHILVILRAWAIWGCTKRMTVTLISIYSVYLLGAITMMAFALKALNFQEMQYMAAANTCILSALSPFAVLVIAASFCLDTTVFGITMWSLWKRLKEYGRQYPSPLVHILIRDVLVFCLVSMFYNSSTAIVVKLYTNDPRNLTWMTFVIPLLSVAGQRLFLNLRGLKVRTYSRSAVISAEIDRQLAALDAVNQPSRQSRGDNNDLQLELLGLEDFGDDELLDVDMVMARSNADAESKLETNVIDISADAGPVIELAEMNMRRRRSIASLSITEVPRLPGESHAQDSMFQC